MSISMIGIDTAKSVFHLHGVDTQGKVQLKRKLSRDKLIPFLSSSRAAPWSWRPAAHPIIGPVC